MTSTFYKDIEPVADFGRALDQGGYRPLPDDWWVGVSDVVDSTQAIAAGRYKAVNMAGAATISAVLNAIDQTDFPFAFCGDGGQFAVADEHASLAREALQRTSRWVRENFALDLRVALVQMRDIRAAGADVTVARYGASPAVAYAMFSGGGMRWLETELKEGRIGLPPATDDTDPDLTGLSCQWGAVRSRNGEILSIIVRPPGAAPSQAFSDAVDRLLTILEKEQRISPVPERGPDLGWPRGSPGLMALIDRRTRSFAARRLRAVAIAAALWVMFRLRLRIGFFDPVHYRKMVGANTDFRKYDDGLYLTVDCGSAVAREVEDLLASAQAAGTLIYGLHRQDEALMTCIVPTVTTDGHFHFLDGGGGGYASAAAQLKPLATGRAAATG